MASAATSMSFFTARVKPHTVAFLTSLDISCTELKSPGLDIGKPASITSTPSSSNLSAMTNFCSVSNLHPGTCSPSLSVVSKICTLSLPIVSINLSNSYENRASGGEGSKNTPYSYNVKSYVVEFKWL